MLGVKAYTAGLSVAVLLAGCSATRHSDQAAVETSTAWPVPTIASLPDNEWGRTVRKGRDLVVKTSALIGPGATDPSRRYAGNRLDCQSCHIDGGTRRFGLPLVGAFLDYPSYRARSGKVGTIEDRVNGCMTRSMNGKPLPLGGADMIAIVSYLKFLSTGRTFSSSSGGRGSGHMAEMSRSADPQRGQGVFASQCAACHGTQGQGQRDTLGYVVPPLWGPDSFNDGAGMARLTNAANFIRNNMPNGTTWAKPVLSVGDAWDVAAFVEAQPRPHKPDLDRDFPNRREKPADTAYGPYADTLSANQHKYGPFAPIRAALGSRDDPD